MDSIIEKLSDIENTAEAIVEHAEAQKYEIEKKIQAKRDQFDKDLEARTQKRLDEIRGRGGSEDGSDPGGATGEEPLDN